MITSENMFECVLRIQTQLSFSYTRSEWLVAMATLPHDLPHWVFWGSQL